MESRRSCRHSFATPLHMVFLLLTLRLVTVVQKCLLSSLSILASPPLNAPARRSLKTDDCRATKIELRPRSKKQFRPLAVTGLPDPQGVLVLQHWARNEWLLSPNGKHKVNQRSYWWFS
ncbi:hypothetical protein DFH08DRAFT_827284 [Mycena albidolilacea]|uniref:Secreted protein n=1 Tax=Mycena albidolilacea TaxID=1033008 RepID=A0AAD6YYI6_9AGAR|nr:hypothetical protein DFH08DRAFT_827284 [Mycena albidolilacea]